MSWYNSGNWDTFDGTTIPHVLADLCNALNERYDCLGHPRKQFFTNAGTEFAPVVSSKSTPFVAADFYGLELHRYDYFDQIFDAVQNLVGWAANNSPMINITRHSGFAKTPTNTGLRANLDTWTVAEIADAAGLPLPVQPVSIFDQNAADFLREAFDRMLYPVVYPVLEHNYTTGLRVYGTSYDNPPTIPDRYNAEAMWDWQKGAPFTLAPDSTLGLSAGVSGSERLVAVRPTVVYRVYYGAGVGLGHRIRMSNLYNPSFAGYLGNVTKTWAHFSGGKQQSTGTPSTGEPGTDDSLLQFSFLGEIVTISGESIPEFETDVPIPLNGYLEADFSLIGQPEENNPFTGFNIGPEGTLISGVGSVAAAPTFKFLKTVGVGTASGWNHVRQIIDITGELSDQM